MIEIYEISAERAQKTAAKFGISVTDLQRVFVMEEGGEIGKTQGEEIGIGVLALSGGTVVVQEVKTDKPFLYFDLLARSLLSVTRDMSPIRVRVKSNPYYLHLGFEQNGDFMEILNKNINFTAACASHANNASHASNGCSDCGAGCNTDCKAGKK